MDLTQNVEDKLRTIVREALEESSGEAAACKSANNAHGIGDKSSHNAYSTGDDPLVDHELVNKVIPSNQNDLITKNASEGINESCDFDYVSRNTFTKDFDDDNPDLLDCEEEIFAKSSNYQFENRKSDDKISLNCGNSFNVDKFIKCLLPSHETLQSTWVKLSSDESTNVSKKDITLTENDDDTTGSDAEDDEWQQYRLDDTLPSHWKPGHDAVDQSQLSGQKKAAPVAVKTEESVAAATAEETEATAEETDMQREVQRCQVRYDHFLFI